VRRRVLSLVIAFALAFGGTAVLLNYARSADERALEGQAATEVFVVAQPIAKGTPAELIGESLRVELVPNVARAADAVDDLTVLEGLVASVDLVAGEQLITSRFVDPTTLVEAPVIEVPEGFQEITLLLPMERILGGRIAPGDRIGILVALAGAEATDEGEGEEGTTEVTAEGAIVKFLLDELLITFVQYTDVPVTAPPVDPNVPPAPTVDLVPPGSLLLTVAVDTVTAEKLAFAMEYGSIRATKLYESTVQSGSRPRTAENLFG